MHALSTPKFPQKSCAGASKNDKIPATADSYVAANSNGIWRFKALENLRKSLHLWTSSFSCDAPLLPEPPPLKGIGDTQGLSFSRLL